MHSTLPKHRLQIEMEMADLNQEQTSLLVMKVTINTSIEQDLLKEERNAARDILRQLVDTSVMLLQALDAKVEVNPEDIVILKREVATAQRLLGIPQIR